MSYTITINGLTKNQAWDLITRLENKTFRLEEKIPVLTPIESTTDTSPTKKGSAIVTLSDKKCQVGSARESVMIVLEKLEEKHGIGSVTRNMLRDQCKQQDVDHTIIYQLIREGFIV